MIRDIMKKKHFCSLFSGHSVFTYNVWYFLHKYNFHSSRGT